MMPEVTVEPVEHRDVQQTMATLRTLAAAGTIIALVSAKINGLLKKPELKGT